MNMTEYLENAILNETLRATNYTPPTTVYLSLHSTESTDTTAGTELTGNGYSRKAITFGAPSGGVCSNTNAITFTTSGNTWAKAISAGIYTAATGGNMLYWSAMPPKTVALNRAVTFEIGSITVSID